MNSYNQIGVKGFVSRLILASLMMISTFVVFESTSVQAVGEPTVSWTETDNQVVSGVASFDATATPTSPAKIVKWCLLFDGVPVTSNVAVPDQAYLDLTDGSFSSSTGCWVLGSWGVNQAKVKWDTTSWASGPHTLQWTVTDSSNRTATSDVLTFTTSNAGPSVSWVSSNNRVVTGVATFDASAAPAASGTATIVKWCLLLDGVPVTSNVAVPDQTYLDLTDGSFSSSTGCWALGSLGSYIHQAKVKWDTTSWASGPHTLQWTVTDSSNRTATSDVLTFTTNNPGPSVSWTETDNQVVSGIASFDATAAPAASGTAKIVKWCLLFDGAPATTAASRMRPTFRSTVNAAFRESATNCVEGTDIREMYVQWDTTTWALGWHTLQWTVTDTSNRTVTSSVLTFSTNNPQPYMVIGNLSPGQVLTGKAEVYLAAMHPGASFVSSYFFVDVAPWGSGSYTEVYPQFTTVRKVVLDTTRMRNGNHIFVGLVNDSAGRQVWSSIIPFSTNNSASTISPSVYSLAQPWPSKSVDSLIVGNFINTDSITIRYGTNKKKLGTEVTLAVINGVVSGGVGGLKASTTYYFEIKGSGINGDSAPIVISSKTPKSSSKPYVSSGGSGGGSSGGSGLLCSVGTNLETCEDRHGLSMGRRLGNTLDCTGKGRGVDWAKNWTIIRITSGKYVISKSSSRCS
jgi:hypothetical protein